MFLFLPYTSSQLVNSLRDAKQNLCFCVLTNLRCFSFASLFLSHFHSLLILSCIAHSVFVSLMYVSRIICCRWFLLHLHLCAFLFLSSSLVCFPLTFFSTAKPRFLSHNRRQWAWRTAGRLWCDSYFTNSVESFHVKQTKKNATIYRSNAHTYTEREWKIIEINWVKKMRANSNKFQCKTYV